jgi:RNase H-fold protein (predicted Holliday junction resolvase)
MNMSITMPRVTFVSRISQMVAKDKVQKVIITVPREFWDEIEPLRQRKQVKVIVEEAYD